VKIANTYAEWVNLLDSFAEGDDTCIETLENSRFTLDAGTASRFYSRIEETYKKRKKRWLENFQKSFAITSIKRIDDFEIALRNGKRNLLPLNRFISITGLPDDLRKVLSKDLVDFVLEIKNSIKNNVSKVSSDRDKMMIMLSSFELPSLQKQEVSIKKDTQTNNINEPSSGRKIIF
jgi:hypothetical protein